MNQVAYIKFSEVYVEIYNDSGVPLIKMFDITTETPIEEWYVTPIAIDEDPREIIAQTIAETYNDKRNSFIDAWSKRDVYNFCYEYLKSNVKWRRQR